MKQLFSLLAVAGSIHMAQAATLVKDHAPQATIVVDDKASEQVKTAARTLQTYIRQSTGATLPIRNATDSSLVINVGMTPYVQSLKSSFGNLDRDEFVLQGTDAKHYVITGGSDKSTEYGVYDFLERYVGVRWLMPTALGEEVPQQSSLDVPEARIKEKPVFLMRYFSPLQTSPQGPQDVYPRFSEWMRSNRLTDRSRVQYHHNLKILFPPSLFAKSHPEFYPLIDSKRYIPKDNIDWHWQPNFSAPGIVDAAAERIVKYFDENPQAASYSLGINDHPNFDQSEASRARRSGRKNYLEKEDVSDDYFLWANAVVEKVLEKYPDKWFGVLAYNEIADPPTRVKVHPRIVPFLTYERLFWLDPELKARNQDIQSRWENASAVLGWYDYQYGLMYMSPRINLHQTQETLKYAVNHQVHYYTAELYPNWGEGPKPWILAKLLWNPNQDADALMDDWCEHAVGRAAAVPLKQYYAIWEKFWTQTIVKTGFWNKSWGIDKVRRQYLSYNDLRYLTEIPESAIQESDRLMQDVVKLSATSRQKQRAEKLALMWEFYKTSYYSYKGEILATQLDGEKADDILKGLDQAEDYISATTKRREIFQSFENDPLYHDVYLRAFKIGNRGGNVEWGYGLITQAQKLARTARRIAGKLEELAQSRNATVKSLAATTLANARR